MPYYDVHPNSAQAWEELQEHVPDIDRAVMLSLQEKPKTCWQVEVHLDMLHQTASAALWRLKKAGLVIETGKNRVNPSQRLAAVHSLAPGVSVRRGTSKET